MHLSAIVWEHINLVGSYQFSEVQLDGEFRPLRDVEQRHRRRPKDEGDSPHPAQVKQAQHAEGDEEETPQQLSLLQEEA
ncbi:hypothetical protein ccbrp13_14200 [Ktedonobacteria bacterium brp13]|nr:hypothetical protein ccbrp13_14200 [Ktedonobacteria bacterium brp13]